jgi:RNA polymerase subunit RPABC4/transcription elongation factor Spt4
MNRHQELITLLEKPKKYCIQWMNKKLKGTHAIYKGKTWTLYVPKNEDNITPALLTAHIDTVGRTQPTVKETHGILHSTNNAVLGGDDRAGVYLIGEMATRLEKPPYVLLCDLEESGMIGAGDFAATGLLEALKANIYIEYDRQGISEYVTYLKPTNSDIGIIMKFFGYQEAHGTFSDVLELSRRTGIAHVNIAAAYRGQHTVHETLSLAGIDFALAVGPALIKTLAKKERTCTKQSAWNSWGSYGSGWNGYADKEDRKGAQVYDTRTGKWKEERDYTPAKESKAYIGYTPPYKSKYEQCPKCRTILLPAENGVCPYCHKDGYTRTESDTCLICGSMLYAEDRGQCPRCTTLALASKQL